MPLYLLPRWRCVARAIKGDPRYGLKPLLPGLKSVADPPRYKQFAVQRSGRAE